MKTHHAGSTRKRIRQGVWAAVLTITGSFALVYPGVAQDLRSFDQAESYLADGQTITLTQRLGQAIIQFDPTVTDTTSLNEITAPNNKRFTLEADLRTGKGLYRMQSDESVTEASNTEAIQSLNSDSRVKYVYPVFADPASGARHFLNDEIVVRLKARITPDDLASFQQLGLKVTDTLSPSENIHVLRLSDPKNYNPFRVCAALLQNAAVLWDEPNMGQEGQPLEFIPDDQIFNYQWHLKNTGQYGATAGADVEATFAWDTTRGSPGIRIAILDNGFETGHEDLADNLIQGYDFYDLDADPNPSTDYDNHGTPVAGIASAAINNGLGLAGVAGGCQILPVRMFESIGWVTHVFPGPAQIYQAIIYAADNADVLNCSWKVSASSTVSAGFQYARDKGRGGMGCAVFCASGNSAAGEGEELGGNQNGYETQQSYNIYNLVGAGSFRIGFEYWKDASGSANDDTVWLADITLPDETLRRLDSLSLPSGWITDGHVSWSGSNTDPVHAHGTSAFAWRAGVIGDNQASRILTSPITVNSSQTNREVKNLDVFPKRRSVSSEGI